MEASTISVRPSRWLRLKASLTPAEWRRAGAMTLFVVALHVIGFVLLFAVIAPHHYALGKTGAFSVGLGFTAYTLGMRHAFDADHIAAIDNTTRKLMNDGQRPMSVGFFFSLGHSTVVFVLSFCLAIGVKALSGPVQNDGSSLHQVTGIVGTAVSGTFLYLIAGLNIVVLAGIVKIFSRMRRGEFDETALEHELAHRGFMNRFFGKYTRGVKQPWHMYPIGILFGLGFDTATEVGLLVLAATAAGAGLPFYAILALPILFAAGMCLLDTLDGSFMNFAYGWAFLKPVRKVYYNITITGLSIAVAFVIGTIEILGLVAQEANLTGGFWNYFQNFNINHAGLIIVGLFVATWVIALGVWRFGHIEDKWNAGLDLAQANEAAVDG
ncbi:MAG TPA: HoxN/HupN/NixA family nickel/cobalt transporter [Solirubrobacteraceae bacterium]|nr:HoxN/HupN/NixA family nickel/cobalt transporter [Solirubrobacteraceae bacterium]